MFSILREMKKCFNYFNYSFIFNNRIIRHIQTIKSNEDFNRVAIALDSNKKPLGRNFGSLFEAEVNTILDESGYQNFFYSDENLVRPLLTIIGIGKDAKSSSEFDAFVTGNDENFGNFRSQFLYSCAGFPPKLEEGRHILIVETKLNSQLLFEWIDSNKIKSGNGRLFFDRKLGENFVKVVVINGGKESKEFVKNMNLPNPDPKFNKYIDALKASRINVFYKLWASGETFQDLFLENEHIKTENEQIRTENEQIRTENQEIKNLLMKYISKDEK